MASDSKDILSGFQINWIILRDTGTGEILWQGNEDYSSSEKTHTINLPKKMLNCQTISSEINFSSAEEIKNFRIGCTFRYKDRVMEKFVLEFGAVVPDSTQCWQSIIHAAPEAKLMNYKILNGNLVLETKFYNEDDLITKSQSSVRYC